MKILPILLLLSTLLLTQEFKKERAVQKYDLKILNEFQSLVSPLKLSKSFIELVKFDDSHDNYIHAFWIENDDDFFYYWLNSDETSQEKIEEYTNQMITFAHARDTGGSYALWLKKGLRSLDDAPIIYYGSEGEVVISAKNLGDFIKILSFEAYPCHHYFDNDEGDIHYKYEKVFEEKRPSFFAFRQWMKEKLDIEPIDISSYLRDENYISKEVEAIKNSITKELKQAFDNWQYQFYPNPKEEMKKYYTKKQKEYKEKKKKLLKKLEKEETAELYIKLAKNETIVEKTDIKARFRYLEKGLVLEPNNIYLLEKLAGAKHIDYYFKLLKLSKKPEQYYTSIAYAYEHKKDYDKAIEYFLKNIEFGRYGQNPIISICKNLKDKDAILILEESLQKKENYTTHNVLYYQYFKKKQYQKSMNHALKYIELSDEQSHNFETVSKEFFEKELYLEALTLFKKTLTKKDSFLSEAMVYNYIGICYLRLDKPLIHKAFKAFKKAYEIQDYQKGIHSNIYLCAKKHIKEENFDKAIEVLTFYIKEIEQDNAEAYYFLSTSYIQVDKNKEALEMIKKTLELEPENKKYKEMYKSIRKINWLEKIVNWF